MLPQLQGKNRQWAVIFLNQSDVCLSGFVSLCLSTGRGGGVRVVAGW